MRAGSGSKAIINRKELKQHEDRILIGLVDYHYKSEFRRDYWDERSGGIYEHQLAEKLDYEVLDEKPAAWFGEACGILENKHLVKRILRQPSQVLAILPTPEGLDHAAYLKLSPFGKAIHQLKSKWPDILVAVVTAAVTATVIAIGTIIVAKLVGFIT